jgi:hypothetical protein
MDSGAFRSAPRAAPRGGVRRCGWVAHSARRLPAALPRSLYEARQSLRADGSEQCARCQESPRVARLPARRPVVIDALDHATTLRDPDHSERPDPEHRRRRVRKSERRDRTARATRTGLRARHQRTACPRRVGTRKARILQAPPPRSPVKPCRYTRRLTDPQDSTDAAPQHTTLHCTGLRGLLGGPRIALLDSVPRGRLVSLQRCGLPFERKGYPIGSGWLTEYRERRTRRKPDPS